MQTKAKFMELRFVENSTNLLEVAKTAGAETAEAQSLLRHFLLWRHRSLSLSLSLFLTGYAQLTNPSGGRGERKTQTFSLPLRSEHEKWLSTALYSRIPLFLLM